MARDDAQLEDAEIAAKDARKQARKSARGAARHAARDADAIGFEQLTEQENGSEAVRARARNIVPVRQPLVLISQVQRSGGHLLSRLFDGHPACLAHPHELQWGFPTKGDWPSFAVEPADADAIFSTLREPWQKRAAARGGLGAGGAASLPDDNGNAQLFPYDYDPQLHRSLFSALLATGPTTTRRHVLDAYLTASFNAWLDCRSLDAAPKRFVTAFIPRVTMNPGSIDGFFADYPDGHLITIVRHPGSWLASAMRSGGLEREHGGQAAAALKIWLTSVERSLDAAARFGNRVTVCIFEELVERTDDSMRRLCQRLGLDFHDALTRPTFNDLPIPSNSLFTPASGIDPLTTQRHLADLAADHAAAVTREILNVYDKVVADYGLGAARSSLSSTAAVAAPVAPPVATPVAPPAPEPARPRPRGAAEPNSLTVDGLGKRYQLALDKRERASLNLKFARVPLPWATSESCRELWALRDVSFAVQPATVLGVIGANGAGKSTLLKILARVVRPTEGRVVGRGRVVSLLELGAGFNQDLSARDNIYMNAAMHGIPRHEVSRRLDDIVEFAGVGKFLDSPLRHYSSGMYLRLAFSVAINMNPDILLADEILAVGDLAFQERCLQRVADEGRNGLTVLFVSHDMAAIARLCHQAMWLNAGRLVRLGDANDVVNAYQAAAYESLTQAADDGGRSNRFIEVAGVHLVSASDGRVIGAAPVDGEVLVRLRLKVLRAPSQVRVTLDLFSKPTHVFRAVQPEPHGFEERGLYDVFARIPADLLAENRYQVTLGIQVDGGERTSTINIGGALTFMTFSSSTAGHYKGGIIRPKLEWTVAAAQADPVAVETPA